MILIGYAILVTLTLLFIFKHKNKFILNEKSLHKQWLFWLAIIAPLVSGIYFGAGIWSEFSLRLDFKGFSNFFDISKFPFGILTLSPILGAFVVSAHRSIQTAKQIETTEKKNKVDTYYAKKKFVNEQLSTITTTNNEKITRITSLYLKAFKVGDFNDEKTNNLLDDIKESLEHFNKLKIINGDFKATDSFILCINNPKDKKHIQNIYLMFTDADYYISKIKDFLYLESKVSIYETFKKCILEYEELYKNNKYDIDNNTFNNNLYEDVRYNYISTYANAIYNIYDIINIIHEIVIILYPDDNINLILPNLVEVKNKIADHKNELSNFD
ncbi:hypothetical protein [Proteus mirabilis]|uniref:hypothetical protein n=1 Tax=Proteus mirabilis TaxID=584 RepID=UPI000F5BDA09|nr:hypothetical protein [Proteus mirabilis]MBS3828842.1 hypothetical protein [Proteus mirabilis]MBS3837424.1 hypothetical protein [Proteus mirabilis]MDC9786495.1 hypothetical protein [Proteus mirabilis]RQW16383.1 hypothetical protein EHQ54_04835 [Proteus mirabilis]